MQIIKSIKRFTKASKYQCYGTNIKYQSGDLTDLKTTTTSLLHCTYLLQTRPCQGQIRQKKSYGNNWNRFQVNTQYIKK